MTRRVERVWFEGSAGDQLNARLDTPDGRPTAYVLFAHCFTCSKEIAAATRIARGLVDQGMGVLRFDFTGLGESEGEFANTNFSSNVDDLVLAADMLRDRYEPPALLVGHSLGGAAVLAAAARVPEAVGVVTIGAPFDPRQLTSLIPPEALSRLDRNGDIVVEIGGRPFPIRRQLLNDVNAQNLTAAIEGLKRALLVFHAPRDELVEIDNARRIFDVAKHPKSFVSLDDADHLLTRPGDAAYVAEVLGAWASRYCTRQAPGNGRATPEGTVVVVDAPKGPVAETIRAGRHTLLADEPAEVGDDTGPTPYDLLLASLGACTAMTVRLYAARKGWPLEHTSLSLRHDRVHAADSVDCDAPRGMIDRIDVDLDLDGPLTDDQRQRLLDIAERCPVHRTLLGEKRITVRLAQDPELVPMSPDRIGGRSIMRSNDDRSRPNGGRS